MGRLGFQHFIKLASGLVALLPLALWAGEVASPLLSLNSAEQGWFERHAHVLISSGMFAGILLIMALYNLFIYWHSRSYNFLYYGLYGLCIFLLAISALGPVAILWPELLWLQQELTLGFGALAAICLGLFANHQLAEFKQSRWLKIALRVTGSLVLITGSVMALSWHWVSIYAVVLSTFAMAVLLVIAGFKLWWREGEHGAAYAVAWSCVAVGFFLTLLQLQGGMGWNLPPHVPLMTGLIIEVVVVSFVLAGSFSDAHNKIVAAHQEALRNAERAKTLQEQAEQAQEEATEELERKVQERTFELEVTLRELEETNHRLEEQSTMDFLTGIKNRKHFDKRYMAEFRRSRREQTPLSVMMLDIDHFKSVNDNYGHLVGDEVIRQVAHQIQAVIKRPSDVLTRYGGEEFAVILPNTPKEGAISVAEEVVQAVRKTSIITGEEPLSVTISAGVSCAVVQPTTEPDKLVAAADQALYQSKTAGRNQASYLALEAHSELS